MTELTPSYTTSSPPGVVVSVSGLTKGTVAYANVKAPPGVERQIRLGADSLGHPIEDPDSGEVVHSRWMITEAAIRGLGAGSGSSSAAKASDKITILLTSHLVRGAFIGGLSTPGSGKKDTTYCGSFTPYLFAIDLEYVDTILANKRELTFGDDLAMIHGSITFPCKADWATEGWSDRSGDLATHIMAATIARKRASTDANVRASAESLKNSAYQALFAGRKLSGFEFRSPRR